MKIQEYVKKRRKKLQKQKIYSQIRSIQLILRLSKKEFKKVKRSEAKPNLCILIHVPDEAKWRICSTRKKEINKLYIKITYSVVKLKSKFLPYLDL